VNEAMQQLDQVVQQNASASEEMASTSEELSAQAEQLQSTISYFRTGEARRPALSAGGNGRQRRREIPMDQPGSKGGNGKAAAGSLHLDMSEDDGDGEFERF
jgi:methyl-accepting chemotaxis protein